MMDANDDFPLDIGPTGSMTGDVVRGELRNFQGSNQIPSDSGSKDCLR